MRKFFSLVCCSLFLFTGCGQTSYFQSTETVEVKEDEAEALQPQDEITSSRIFIQVAGAVVTPGVYELSADSRVYEAIEAAGGMLDSADDSDINQASFLEDGQKIYIYTAEERQEQALLEESSKRDDGLVNINTASIDELTSLPGIGEAKAKQIIAYRDSNGLFSSTDDIKNVSGIGEGIFNRIISHIKI